MSKVGYEYCFCSHEFLCKHINVQFWKVGCKFNHLTNLDTSLGFNLIVKIHHPNPYWMCTFHWIHLLIIPHIFAHVIFFYNSVYFPLNSPGHVNFGEKEQGRGSCDTSQRETLDPATQCYSIFISLCHSFWSQRALVCGSRE